MDKQPLNTGEQKDMAEFFTDLISKLEEMDDDLVASTSVYLLMLSIHIVDSHPVFIFMGPRESYIYLYSEDFSHRRRFLHSNCTWTQLYLAIFHFY